LEIVAITTKTVLGR